MKDLRSSPPGILLHSGIFICVSTRLNPIFINKSKIDINLSPEENKGSVVRDCHYTQKQPHRTRRNDSYSGSPKYGSWFRVTVLLMLWIVVWCDGGSEVYGAERDCIEFVENPV